jgi:hypothetical protein
MQGTQNRAKRKGQDAGFTVDMALGINFMKCTSWKGKQKLPRVLGHAGTNII